MRLRHVCGLASLVSTLALGVFAGCLGEDPETVGPSAEAGPGSSGSSGGGDGSTTPLPDVDGSSSEGGSGGTPIALGNADFENGCNEWVADESLAAPEDAGRSPTRSCLVCFNGVQDFNIVQRVIRSDLQPGARFRARAFLRRPLQGNPAQKANVYIQAESEDLTVFGRDEKPTGVMPLTDQWQPSESVMTVEDAGATKIAVYVFGQRAITMDGCFLVDDVTLVRE